MNETVKQTTKPALLLLPNVLGDVLHHELFLPPAVDRAVATLDGLIAESAGGGRRFLGRFDTKKPAIDMPLALLNEHTPEADLDFLLEPVLKGQRWGLISDGGLPCIADPGSKLVEKARKHGVAVQAFSGPSSILLSLMLSGMPGQRFSFLGYLDKDPVHRRRDILDLQARSVKEGATQIFIEAPYRNEHTMQSLFEHLDEKTKLCIAWDLTLPTQGVLSQTVALWKKSPPPALSKRCAIFLVCASIKK